MTKFSIITICYNSEITLERTIKSVLSQSYTDYEYIIVDGASNDKTLEILKQYEPLFNGRMKWISEPDKGIYDAMNKGIRMAKGEILGIVNSDDWLNPDALQLINNAYIENDKSLNSIYIGWMKFLYDDGDFQIIKTSFDKLKKYAKIYRMAGVNHPATFVPKHIYEKVGLFDDRMKITADADFILRCYYAGVKFIFVNSILTNMKDGGVSNQKGIVKRTYWDRKILLKKYKMSRLQYWYYQLCCLIPILVKKVLPLFVLKMHRKSNM